MIIVTAALLATGEWRQWGTLGAREFGLAAAAGAALAFHFWSWNASIHRTTIAASVTLVSLQPAVIVAISAVFLRERPSGRQMAGIALAICGAFVIAAPDLGIGSHASGSPLDDTAVLNDATSGNLLALIAAVLAAIYYTIGRHLRMRLGLWAYVGLAYFACTVCLVILTALTGTSLTPQPTRELAIFAALALGPMLLGHTGMNWALKYLPAFVVNLVVLGEPIGATILAAVLPGIAQVPTAGTLIGGAIVLTGVVIAARRTPESVRS